MSIITRRLKNGRTAYDVKLRTPDGRQYGHSFRTRKEAVAFQVQERAAQMQGSWVDPRAGRLTLGAYAERWLAQRVGLRPRTQELYDYLLRHHVLPTFAGTELKAITVARVRAWHAELNCKPSIGPSTVTKAYRLLRTILATAVEDEILTRNPCLLKGAGVERPAERPVASVAEVAALADAVEGRYKAMVLLATWGGLRFGELVGLTRGDLDLAKRTVRVVRQVQELIDGRQVVGPPKSDAGRRSVALPPHVVPELKRHLAEWVDAEPSSLVFASPEGGVLRRSNFNRRVWQPACAAVGLRDFRFHDLRHTGNTLAASTGASTKELMSRMGHASPRAALIYQHATSERDQALAEASPGWPNRTKRDNRRSDPWSPAHPNVR
ncbi:MAG: tyrosine-type recombinase/integrase [Acidimicrobiales bacterium]